MKLRVLDAEALRRSLPMAETIEAMKRAFAAYSSGAATAPQRLALAVPPDDGSSWSSPPSCRVLVSGPS